MQNLMAVRGRTASRPGEEAPEALFFQLLQENLKEYHRRGGDLEEAKKCLVMTAEERGAASEGAGQDPASVSGQICPADAAVTMTAKGIWRRLLVYLGRDRRKYPR